RGRSAAPGSQCRQAAPRARVGAGIYGSAQKCSHRVEFRGKAAVGAKRTLNMPKSDLFFKVEIEHDEKERPEKIGQEICRQLMKFYGVLSAELSSFTTTED